MRLIRIFAGLILPVFLTAQTNEAGIDQGKAVFRSNCAFCHGLTAQGGRGPSLVLSALLRGASDSAITDIIQHGVAGTTMPAFTFEKDDLENLVRFLRMVGGAGQTQAKIEGDPAAGRTVYARSGCSNCHRIEEEGSIFGPELTRVGAGRSLEYLRESIVDPSADIADNYGGVTVVTKEGKRVSGVRINEDTFSVQIRKLDQTFGFFDKSEIQEVIHESKSMMPAYQHLSETDLKNLLAYLQTLRGPHATGAQANKAEGIH